MTKSKYLVASYGVEGRDHVLLKSLIGLLNVGAEADWGYTDDMRADVMLVDLDTKEGRSYWKRKSSQNGQQLMIPVSVIEPINRNQRHLKKPLRSVRLRALFKSLVNADGKLIGSKSAKTQVGSDRENVVSITGSNQSHDSSGSKSEEKNDAAEYQSEDLFIDIITPRRVTRPYRFSHQLIKPFVIDPVAKSAYITSHIDDLVSLSSAQKSDIHYGPIVDKSLDDFIAGSQRIPISRLHWTFGLSLSNGRLLSELNNNQVYQLSRWPDFGSLPHSILHSRMATEMMMAPKSVSNFIAAGRDGNEVIGFFNACYLCGWITTEGTAKEVNAKKAGKRDTVNLAVSKIRARLGIARTRVSDESAARA